MELIGIPSSIHMWSSGIDRQRLVHINRQVTINVWCLAQQICNTHKHNLTAAQVKNTPLTIQNMKRSRLIESLFQAAALFLQISRCSDEYFINTHTPGTGCLCVCNKVWTLILKLWTFQQQAVRGDKSHKEWELLHATGSDPHLHTRTKKPYSYDSAHAFFIYLMYSIFNSLTPNVFYRNQWVDNSQKRETERERDREREREREITATTCRHRILIL